MKIIPLTQRTSEWNQWRAKGVTASEAPIILGRSPYKTRRQLWNERIGLAEPEDLSSKPCVQRGIKMEDQVRQGFEDRHDTFLLPFCAESTEHSVLRASLDGLSDDGEPVELKVPTEKTYQAIVAQGVQATAYQLAWVQLQHQLYVTGASQGWLVFDPCLPDQPSLEFQINRDDGFIDNELVPACLQFWTAIETGKPPELDPEQDIYVPADGALDQWSTAADVYRKLMQDRHRLEQQLKPIKDQLAQAEATFVRLMGKHLLAEAAGVRVTRYHQQGSVDYASLLVEIAPDLDQAVVEQHRRKASDRVKVTLQSTDQPLLVKPAHQPVAPAQSFYF